MVKRIISAALSLLFIAAAFWGCNKKETPQPQTNQRQLNITYSDEKFGSDWINAIADNYKKENPEVSIKLNIDKTIDKKAGLMLEKDENQSDLILLSDTNWQYWASKNYLEDLSSVYNSTGQDGKKFKDKMDSECEDYYNFNDKYYAVPLDKSVAGFIYNKKMFEQNGWTVPENMSDFSDLLVKIKLANIIPIAWGGKNIEDWDPIVKNWWTQIDGEESIKTYLNLESPEVYKSLGRTESLKQFQTLVLETGNSTSDVLSSDNKKALSLFQSGKAAMLVGSSFTAAQGTMPKDFEMALMKVPKAIPTEDNNINVLMPNSIMVVPSQAKNIDEAKKFIEFMSTDKMLRLFTNKTSTPRPFKYSTDYLENETTFTKSVLEIAEKSKNLYFYSKNPLYYNELSDWPMQGSPYMRIFTGIVTPQDAVEENYKYVKENFENLTGKAS